MKVSETANCVLSLIVTRFADVVGIVLHGLVRPAQYVEEILRFYCKWGKGRSEYTVLNYFLIQLIVFLKLDSQTQLSNSVLKFSSQIQFSNSVLKFSSQIQFSNSAPFRGSAPSPMQGEVSPYDPLFSAHPASSSQRQSLCGTQNNPPRSDFFKYPYFLHRSGARFCSKGRRITWLSGAARTPMKRKSAQPHFKSRGARDLK
jgi:hypothetical protein